jgi:hypothetical protein
MDRNEKPLGMDMPWVMEGLKKKRSGWRMRLGIERAKAGSLEILQQGLLIEAILFGG